MSDANDRTGDVDGLKRKRREVSDAVQLVEAGEISGGEIQRAEALLSDAEHLGIDAEWLKQMRARLENARRKRTSMSGLF